MNNRLFRFTLEDGKPEHYTHSLESAIERMVDVPLHADLKKLAPGASMPLWTGPLSVERIL